MAFEDGTTTSYALASAQERGQMFVSPVAEVYKGQIVGFVIQCVQKESCNKCPLKQRTDRYIQL